MGNFLMNLAKQVKRRKFAQQKADLRCCASCEFVFSNKEYLNCNGCPVCSYATYGARYVYGKIRRRKEKNEKKLCDKIIEYSVRRAKKEADALIAKANQNRRKTFMELLQI